MLFYLNGNKHIKEKKKVFMQQSLETIKKSYELAYICSLSDENCDINKIAEKICH